MAKSSKEIVQYEPDHKMSKAQRAAHFLDWGAAKYPGRFFSYPEVTQAIEGYGRMPRLDNAEVQRIRHAISAGSRGILVKKYNREVISVPGVGVRATFDDADRLQNVAPKKAKRLGAARRSFMSTAEAINLNKVPNMAAYAPLKAWMGREVKDVLKLIGSPEFERKLLPPSTKAPESNEN